MVWLLDGTCRRWSLDLFSRPVWVDLGGIVWGSAAEYKNKMLAEDFRRQYLTGPRPRRPGEDYKKWVRRPGWLRGRGMSF